MTLSSVSSRYWRFVDSGPAGQIAADVEHCQALGMAGVLVPQTFAPPWAALGVAAAASSTLELASGIALTFTRSPVETATAALDLDRLSGGRFVLGLGASVRGWNKDRFGVAYDPPLSRLREAVTLIKRLVTAGEQESVGRYDGDFIRLDLRKTRLPRPVRPTIPIWLGALRRRAIELTAEVADGLLGHPAWSIEWLTGEAQRGIEAGLERAGKGRADFRVVAWLRVAISDEIDRATTDAKACIPPYAAMPQYTSYYAAHGFGEEALRLQRLAAFGASPAELAQAVPDAMARAFVLVGSAAEVRDRIDALAGHIDDLCLTPPTGLSREAIAAYAYAIEESLIRRS